MATRAGSKVLTDHDEIRQWAEKRDARPSAVKRTARGGDPGILRLDFPGYSGENSLEEISWDEFFEKFDENSLALLVQDRTANGQRSNFNKIISRETARQAATKRTRSSTSSRRTASSGSRSRTATRSTGSSSRKSSRSSGSSGGSSGRKSSRPAASRSTNVRSMKRTSRSSGSSGSRRRAA